MIDAVERDLREALRRGRCGVSSSIGRPSRAQRRGRRARRTRRRSPNIQSAPVLRKKPRCHFASCARHSCIARDGHLRVDRARAVGGADDARLAAGARARVARSPRVDQRDARAAPAQLERGPAAERAGADHRDAHRLALRHAVHAGCRRHHRQQDRCLEHVAAARSHPRLDTPVTAAWRSSARAASFAVMNFATSFFSALCADGRV